MHYSAQQFDYDAETKTYSQEVSTLLGGKHGVIYGPFPAPSKHMGITIDGKAFMFVGEERDATGEDIYVWNFRAFIDESSTDPRYNDNVVKIFND